MANRAAEARDYLRDWLAGEDYWARAEPGSLDWFGGLADHVARLAPEDPRLLSAEICLEPFLEDDPRIDSAIYPAGYAITYVAKTPWGGDFDEYLAGFLAALRRDHALWQRAVELDGAGARWTHQHNLLDDVRLNRRGRWVYGPVRRDGGQLVEHRPAPRCGAPISSPRARGTTCGMVLGHSGRHRSIEARRAAYLRSVAKRYPDGLIAVIASRMERHN